MIYNWVSSKRLFTPKHHPVMLALAATVHVGYLLSAIYTVQQTYDWNDFSLLAQQVYAFAS